MRGHADRHPRVEADPLDPSNRRISILLRFRDLGADEATPVADSVPGVIPTRAALAPPPRPAPAGD